MTRHQLHQLLLDYYTYLHLWNDIMDRADVDLSDENTQRIWETCFRIEDKIWYSLAPECRDDA